VLHNLFSPFAGDREHSFDLLLKCVCAMLINQTGAAVDFLQMLNREFPNDPEVLFLSV
jgi:hypothetical protein